MLHLSKCSCHLGTNWSIWQKHMKLLHPWFFRDNPPSLMVLPSLLHFFTHGSSEFDALLHSWSFRAETFQPWFFRAKPPYFKKIQWRFPGALASSNRITNHPNYPCLDLKTVFQVPSSFIRICWYPGLRFNLERFLTSCIILFSLSLFTNIMSFWLLLINFFDWFAKTSEIFSLPL